MTNPKSEMVSECCEKTVLQFSVLMWDFVWGERESEYYFYICSKCHKPTKPVKAKEKGG